MSPHKAPACLFQVKDSAQQPQMVFTVRHATVTFQTEGDTWREQKEQRAALMVGILIGVFALCWIPFFLTELISPLCSLLFLFPPVIPYDSKSIPFESTL